jgi:hypothetical protein
MRASPRGDIRPLAFIKMPFDLSLPTLRSSAASAADFGQICTRSVLAPCAMVANRIDRSRESPRV